MSTPIAAPGPVTNTPAANTNVPVTTTEGAPTQGGSQQGSSQSAAQLFREIKIDGKVERIPESEVDALISLGKSSNKRFEESAKMKREVDGYMSRMRTPEDLFELAEDPALGYDQERFIKAMEDYYYRKVVQPSEMTPEQRELAEAKERLKKYQAQDEQRAEKLKKDEEAKLDAVEAQKLQREIIELINESKLPKSRLTVSRFAHWMRINLSEGLNAPKELLIQQVRRDVREHMDSMLQGADGEVLLGILGDDTSKKVRKMQIDQIIAKRQAKLGLPPGQPRQVQPDQPRPAKIDEREVRRRAREFR